MTPTVVLVNDAEHARTLLAPVMAQAPERRWVVVVCTPRLTRRIGKFSSQQSRHQWRAQWAQRLLQQLRPVFATPSQVLTDTVVAEAPLPQVVQRLRERFGATLQLFDARKPRLGGTLEQAERQAQPEGQRWLAPIAVSSGMSLVLALAD
jgi:hypothetical protein